MVVTRKSLPRRTVLRGLGITLALPLLDAMVPALTAQVRTAAKPVRRFLAAYIPNGVAVQLKMPDGGTIDHWTPLSEGKGLTLPQILKPLETLKNQVTVVSGLACRPAESYGDAGGDHARACAAWLSAAHPKRSAYEPHNGVTFDQIVANAWASETQLKSLQVGLDDFGVVTGCEQGYACSYLNGLSWASPTTPLPCLVDPRLVFERLFGDSRDPGARRRQLAEDRSILDSVTAATASLQRTLGGRDRARVNEYLEGIRELEVRIGSIEAQAGAHAIDLPDRPVGIPDLFEDHCKLMSDLQVLAFQADVTRVSTFLIAREGSYRPYPQIGVPEAHHGLSHHGNDAEKIGKMVRINTYHVQMLAYLLGKLQATPDGDGSLLDRSLVLYGGGMSNGNLHTHGPLPMLLAGGAGRHIGDRHISFAEGTPMANLLLTIGDFLDVPIEAFGDSTGRLAGI
jgi:hypothetical protein